MGAPSISNLMIGLKKPWSHGKSSKSAERLSSWTRLGLGGRSVSIGSEHWSRTATPRKSTCGGRRVVLLIH
jgi:hypothetical protein